MIIIIFVRRLETLQITQPKNLCRFENTYAKQNRIENILEYHLLSEDRSIAQSFFA